MNNSIKLYNFYLLYSIFHFYKHHIILSSIILFIGKKTYRLIVPFVNINTVILPKSTVSFSMFFLLVILFMAIHLSSHSYRFLIILYIYTVNFLFFIFSNVKYFYHFLLLVYYFIIFPLCFFNCLFVLIFFRIFSFFFLSFLLSSNICNISKSYKILHYTYS